MRKIPLTEQLQALEKIAKAYGQVVRKEMDGLTLNEHDALRAAIATLKWLVDNDGIAHLAKTIYMDDAVGLVRDAFPGAVIARCSKIDGAKP